ncbi:MAG: hypothetical protein JNN15_21070 [Blastocatellia bacterium]|nr:hypothetical protein [Blastocatellia bacterium]
MKSLVLQIKLKSDTTFGRGDGVAGLVDVEVEHDRYGMPFLRGRTLKGLLVEECANILYSLDSGSQKWHKEAQFLFGSPGSSLKDDGEMFVGDACLPEDLSDVIKQAVKNETFTSLEILESLTAIRRQTAMSVKGAPVKGSLRSMRVVLRETFFEAKLTFQKPPKDRDQALLAACVASLQRVGTGRNRGRGRVEVCLLENDKDITNNCLDIFAREITE